MHCTSTFLSKKKVKMPLHKLMGTYTCLWTIADVVEQKYISKKPVYDYKKTIRMVSCGTFVVAPLVFVWINLSRRLVPGNSVKVALKKVVLEQTTFAPVAVSTFYAATSILERKTFNEFAAEWQQKFPRTYKTGLCFWPFVQFVNFTVVPAAYHTYFVASGSFLWSIFLCFMKESKKKDPQITQDMEGKD